MNLRDLFPGYYRPTEAEFRKMWEEGIVSVDANILLHVYRYSPALRQTLFDLMEKVGNRLWIPNRVAFEFSRNRLKVISGQEKAYDDACAVLEKVTGIIKSELPPRHPVIDIDEIKGTFLTLISQKQEALKRLKAKHPQVPDDDPALAKLSSLLGGKIGSGDAPDREQKYPDEGEKRYKAKIPPGFRDASKDDDPLQRYGDYIVWRQLLDQVQAVKAPFFIFATDDSSDDWWWKQDGKTIGPHPSLIHEAKREANSRAYLYRGDQFIRYGTQHFGLKADEKLFDEAATVRREIRSRASANRFVRRFQVTQALVSLGQIEDQVLLNDLTSRIWRAQRNPGKRESLDARLKQCNLPSAEAILELATQVPIRVHGSLKHREEARSPDLPTAPPPDRSPPAESASQGGS